MRRIVLWLLGTLSSLVLLFGYHTSTNATTIASSPTSIVAGESSSSSSTSGSGTGSSGTGPSGTGSSGTESTGSSIVTGDVASTRWGPVQVELTVEGGVITQVSVPRSPSGNQKDLQINNYALPRLIQETIDAQSAAIDMVSGATVTSDGYLQSLQSALDQAGL